MGRTIDGQEIWYHWRLYCIVSGETIFFATIFLIIMIYRAWKERKGKKIGVFSLFMRAPFFYVQSQQQIFVWFWHFYFNFYGKKILFKSFLLKNFISIKYIFYAYVYIYVFAMKFWALLSLKFLIIIVIINIF